MSDCLVAGHGDVAETGFRADLGQGRFTAEGSNTVCQVQAEALAATLQQPVVRDRTQRWIRSRCHGERSEGAQAQSTGVCKLRCAPASVQVPSLSGDGSTRHTQISGSPDRSSALILEPERWCGTVMTVRASLDREAQEGLQWPLRTAA